MNARATRAVAGRVLTQLRHDPRTVALLLAVPSILLVILRFVFDDRPEVFDRIGGPLLGLFPFISMFVVTSITMLRERTTGTLERLMTMPIAKLDILAGYAVAFCTMAIAQTGLVAAVGFWFLGLTVAGSAGAVVGLAVANAFLGTALGLFLSAFATSEFQAVQFMPAFVFPQMLLSGLFTDRSDMAPALEAVAMALPMTYAYDALDHVTMGRPLEIGFVVDVAVTVAASVGALGLAALTLRRRTR